MSDVSLSPTPSQENRANVMDATMYNAIDTFMANEEQSYDNFMNQFTHLTQDDVKAEMLRKREVMLKKMKESLPTSVPEGDKQSSVPEGNDDTCPGGLTGEEEELEEEILDFGTTSSIMTRGVNDGPKQSGVKFDNFVELDVDDDEDLLEDSDYVASFAGQKPSVKPEEPCMSQRGQEEDAQETDCPGEITPASIAVRELSEGVSSIDNDVINPGEVEDLPSSVPVTQKDRTLDFSAKYMEGEPTTDDHQECTDEVEPFSLDTDFDYDNVILTPKYSQADVKLMKTMRDENQTEKTDSQENET